nr:hypothetical protein [Tanacetum cinerariifolium]
MIRSRNPPNSGSHTRPRRHLVPSALTSKDCYVSSQLVHEHESILYLFCLAYQQPHSPSSGDNEFRNRNHSGVLPTYAASCSAPFDPGCVVGFCDRLSMHMRNEPSFFLMNNTGVPHGDELGRIKPFSDSSFCCSDSSFNSDGANRYGARATGVAPGIRSMRNSTCLGGESPELLAKFQAQEMEINILKERVKILEDKEGVIGDKSGDDAPIKRRSTNEGEAHAERIRNDSEEIARVLTSMDVATDRATIVKSSTLPHDSATRVTSLAVDEGNDAPIKGRSINEEEAAAERISNDSEEIARVLTSMDAATVLAGGIDVPTGSGVIPTAGPSATVISTGSEVGPSASPIVTRRKGKEVMVEFDTPKKKKLQEQIDAQVSKELEEQQEKEDMRMNE